MTEDYILGNLDVASIALWLFFGFFVALVIWIQRENQREGYPLVTDDEAGVDAGSVFPDPADKTFILPHGRGTYTVPSAQPPERDGINALLTRPYDSAGFPYDPSGDPFVDGVGPAAWANRRDEPELDGHGNPKLIPMASTDHFHVAAGRDPRGLPVIAGDGEIVGTVTDMWIDHPEQLVRYLQYDLNPEFGSGTRVVPLTMARIWGKTVRVVSLHSHNFAGVPTLKSASQMTKLEEDKISAYYAGGYLYASQDRFEPQL